MWRRPRVRKSVLAKGLGRSSTQRHRECRVGNSVDRPKPGGNADDSQNKGVARKEIRNNMKTRDIQIYPKHEWRLRLCRKAEADEVQEKRITHFRRRPRGWEPNAWRTVACIY